MVDRGARRVVTVPDVVGLPFHIGRDLARTASEAIERRYSDAPAKRTEQTMQVVNLLAVIVAVLLGGEVIPIESRFMSYRDNS